MMSSQYNKFGRLPTMPESWRRTYMLVDDNDNASSTSLQQELMQIEEGRQYEVMQEQGEEGQEQGEEGHHSSSKKRYRGYTDSDEIGRIGDEIEKAYKELIDQGVEVEVANAQSLIKATGRNTRLRHDPNSKTTQKGTKRAPQSSTQQKQIEELKEELEAERKKRKEHEAELEIERKERLAQQELEKKKHQDLELKFQLLYSHLADKGLAPSNIAMPSPANEVNTSSRASNDQGA